MNTLEAIKKRRSVRRFDPQKGVTQKQMAILLEAARWAPSAGNLQSRHLFITRGQKIKNQLALAAWGQVWVAQAPVVLVICADTKKARAYRQRGQELYAVQDATLAGQNIWLAATEIGLGAVWVGAFSEKLVSKILRLESHFRPITIMPLGHPAKAPSQPRVAQSDL